MIHSDDASAADDAVVCVPDLVEVAVEAELDQLIIWGLGCLDFCPVLLIF